MRRARAAASLELFSEPAPRAVEAHRGVVRSDAEGPGHGAKGLLVQVHALDQLGVFRLESRQEPPKARADLATDLRFVGGGVLRQLGREQARLRSGSAIVVDDGVSQQPIEPGHRAFSVTDGAGLLDAPDEGRLEDVLGLRAASHAAFEEGQEPPMVLHECFDDARVLARLAQPLVIVAQGGVALCS